MESVCLGTMPVSGDNIVLWIEEILEKFGINIEKVVSFIHDNRSNSGKILTEKFEWSCESCAGHDLQLCIKAGLEVDEIHQLVLLEDWLNIKVSWLLLLCKSINNKCYPMKIVSLHYKLFKM